MGSGDIEKKSLKGYAFGHSGSGNLHMEIMGIPEEKAQWQKVRDGRGRKIVSFGPGMRRNSDRRAWHWDRKEKFMEKEHGESIFDETDQKAPESNGS